MQMNNGKYISQQKVILPKEHDEMWQLQTIIPTKTRAPYNTHFNGYDQVGFNVL
jgi:hypothetical protein